MTFANHLDSHAHLSSWQSQGLSLIGQERGGYSNYKLEKAAESDKAESYFDDSMESDKAESYFDDSMDHDEQPHEETKEE